MTSTDSAGQRAQRFRDLQREAEAQAARYRRQAEAWEKGSVGERHVSSLLDVLEGARWRVLNDRRRQPGSPANIDHIVVGPPGVCVIDTKNWTQGRLRRDERGIAMAGYRRDDELHAAKVVGDIVRATTRTIDARVAVCPALVFVQDVGLEQPDFHHQVALLQADQLLVWLTSQPAWLQERDVDRLARALDAAFPPRLREKAARTRPSAPRPPRAASVRARRPVASPRRAGRNGGIDLGELLLKLLLLLLLVTVMPLVVQHALDSAVTPRNAPGAAAPGTPR